MEFDSVKVDVAIENDSMYSCDLKYYVQTKTKINRNNANFVIYRGYKSNSAFWIATGSLATASVFYISAAWSDPVVYVQNHDKYTRSYFNNAKNKRNALVIGGTIFTGVAVYFYSKLIHKKRVRWIVGPDGIKYTF